MKLGDFLLGTFQGNSKASTTNYGENLFCNKTKTEEELRIRFFIYQERLYEKEISSINFSHISMYLYFYPSGIYSDILIKSSDYITPVLGSCRLWNLNQIYVENQLKKWMKRTLFEYIRESTTHVEKLGRFTFLKNTELW